MLAMRAMGASNDDIAKELGLAERTLRQYLYLAGRNGWLRTADPAEELEFALSHKVVRNVSAILDGEVATAQQHDMTIEMAKGIGLFKTHTTVKSEGVASSMTLAVKIEMPVGVVPEVSTDHMGGAPAYIEGEVVK